MDAFITLDPSFERAIVLPNRQFGDSFKRDVDIQTKWMMDGTLYTYVLNKGYQILELNYVLTCEKAREFQEYYEDYAGAKHVFYRGFETAYSGIFVTEPAVMTYERRGVYCQSNDVVSLNITFAGE